MRKLRLRLVQRPALRRTATEHRSWDLQQLCLPLGALLALFPCLEHDSEQQTLPAKGRKHRGLGKLGAKVGMERGPGAWYLQQGQGPCEADAAAAKRRAGGKDAGLVQHLVP